MMVLGQCEKCGGGIEFAAEDEGQEGSCPLCNETTSFRASPLKPKAKARAWRFNFKIHWMLVLLLVAIVLSSLLQLLNKQWEWESMGRTVTLVFSIGFLIRFAPYIFTGIGQILGALVSKEALVLAFTLAGIVVIAHAATLKSESAIHQIYVQLNYITGVACLGVAAIVHQVGQRAR